MAQIPTYNDSITAQGGINSQANPNAFGAQLGSAITRAAEVAHDYVETDEVTRAHRLASAKQLEWEQSLDDRAKSASPGNREFADSLITDVGKDLQQAGDQFKTRRAQQVFSSLSDNLKTSVGLKAIHIQKDLDGRDVQQKFEGTVDDESKLVNGNEGNYKGSVQRVNDMIDDPNSDYKRVDQVTRNGLKAKAKQVLAMSAVEGYFARNIYGAASKLLPAQVTEAYTGAAKGGSKYDMTMQFIFKEEGGYKDKDGNSNAPVNFGINQKANPDIDVKTLTKDGANKIYRERYWNVIGGDNLPPNMAVVAMNAAVNMGADTAKTLLAKSGGDPAMFTELVKQRYESIAANDKSQAKYLPTWLARADRAFAASDVPVDVQGKPMPQLKIPKDAALAPNQTTDIPGWNDLTLDTQQKYMNKLVTDFNSRIASDRATLADDRANMHSNLLAGNKYDAEKSVQSRYAQAYGAEMASRMIAEDANAKALGQFTKGIRGQSLVEIATAMGPAPKDNATASDYETYKRKEAAVKADREELKQDPVSYVARYSTPVRQAAIVAQAARQEAQQNPSHAAEQNAQSATQKLIASSLAEQRRLGIANPEILSKDEEKQLTAEIERIQGSGQNVAQGIDALYKSYGSYGPTVAAQMAPKVGGLMNVLGSEIDPNAAALLVEANRNKDALKKTISEDKLKDLDVAVQAVMSNYSASLVGVPNGSNVQANYQEQIMTLAMARMSKLGESQGDAVQKAYKALVADQYTFQDGYRVPVKLDAKAIQRQANTTLSNIKPSDVALLPGSLGNPDDRMQAQLSSIRAYGRWVTTSQTGADGKLQEGLTLMIPTPGGFSPVPSADGKPLFRSFGQMLVDYQAGGIQTSQEALQRNDMATYNKLRAQERADARRAEDQRAADIGRAFRAGK